MNKIIRNIVVMGGNVPYYRKIQNIFGPSLIAYWPLWDAVGSSSAKEIIADLPNTSSANITYGNAGIGDGKTSASFNGTSSVINLLSAGLIAKTVPTEGSLFMWMKTSSVDIWGNESADYAVRAIFENDLAVRSAGNNTLVYSMFGGDLNGLGTSATAKLENWFPIALTWNWAENRARAYFKGLLDKSKTMTDPTGQSLAALRLGSSNGSASFWDGNLAHIFMLNREATAAEVYSAYTAMRQPFRFTFIGDSITYGGFPYMVVDKFNNGFCTIINHGHSGDTIMANLDGQVAASATDNAQIIIIELGTNDNSAGDMAALQAKVESNIAALKLSNPNATIYYVNNLPRWTDVGGGTPADKATIRAAIIAACASQGITCWDTYTTPWIAAADTLDGVHPNIATGCGKVATEIVARL